MLRIYILAQTVSMAFQCSTVRFCPQSQASFVRVTTVLNGFESDEFIDNRLFGHWRHWIVAHTHTQIH